jgi:hypothetical protein
MKSMARFLIALGLFTGCLTQPLFSQQDTSSFFPLGLWGIWITGSADSPWPPHILTQNKWVAEKNNFGAIGANYLIHSMPYTILDTIMNYTDNAGYKVDIHRGKYSNGSLQEYGLPSLVNQLRGTTDFPVGWKDTADARIRYE